MDYTKIYETLIDRARERTLEGYKERHHILPRCMGGNDEKENLIDLTAREHFIAHLLLVKMSPKQYGLIKAVNMMCIGSDTNERTSKNRMYGWLKEKLSEAISIQNSVLQKGEGNSQFGTVWIYNEIMKKSKKIPSDELEHWMSEGWTEGWTEGRSLSKYCVDCNKKLNNRNKTGKCRTCLGDNMTAEIRSKGGLAHAKASEEDIVTILKESGSYKECMIKLGYKKAGGNAFKRVRNIAKKYDLEY